MVNALKYLFISKFRRSAGIRSLTPKFVALLGALPMLASGIVPYLPGDEPFSVHLGTQSPFQRVLKVKTTENGFGTGTYLGDGWVLTAAHVVCPANSTTALPIAQLSVAQGAGEVSVDAVHVFASYNSSSFVGDVAMLHLDDSDPEYLDLPATGLNLAFVSPSSLSRFNGSHLHLCGYGGLDSDGSGEGVLRVGASPVASITNALLENKGTSPQLPVTTAFGDSGGSVIGNFNGNFAVFAVISAISSATGLPQDRSTYSTMVGESGVKNFITNLYPGAHFIDASTSPLPLAPQKPVLPPDPPFYTSGPAFGQLVAGMHPSIVEDFRSARKSASGYFGVIGDTLVSGVANGSMPYGTVIGAGVSIQSNTLGATAGTTLSPRGKMGLYLSEGGGYVFNRRSIETYDPDDSLDLIFSIPGNTVGAVGLCLSLEGEVGNVVAKAYGENGLIGECTIENVQATRGGFGLSVVAPVGEKITRINLAKGGSANSETYLLVGSIQVYAHAPISQIPEIAVEEITSIPDEFESFNAVVSDQYVEAGNLSVGETSILTFNVVNIGNAPLAGMVIFKSGIDAADFTVDQTTLPDQSLTYGATRFTVTFAPSTPGHKSASIHITSNDADENPFTIKLSGGVEEPGVVDLSFDTSHILENSFRCSSMAELPDGKLLVIGSFKYEANLSNAGIHRLNANGSLDTDFIGQVLPSALSGDLAVQSDGKILCGLRGNNSNQVSIGRLFPDGSIDPSFTVTFTQADAESYASIEQITPLRDGRILVAGNFSAVNGQAQNGIASLLPDGSFDSDFRPLVTYDEFDGLVSTIAVQADGKILIGGAFKQVNGEPRNNIVRLNPDGSVDSLLNFDIGDGANSQVTSLVLQRDGKILVAGYFDQFDGVAINSLVRLLPDGSRDTGFNPSPMKSLESSITIKSVLPQADGRILIEGSFSEVGGMRREGLARLLVDGSLDAGFIPPRLFNEKITLLKNGGILVAGLGLRASGLFSDGLFLLKNDAATSALSVSGGNRVEWLRGGASPDTEDPIFEISTDGGMSYDALGAGVAIPGGWEVTGLSLRVSGQIRARIRTVGGLPNVGSGLIEEVLVFGRAAAPQISVQQHFGTNLVSNSSQNLGNLEVGQIVERTFFIRNTGESTLADVEVSILQDNPQDFVVVKQPASSVSGPSGITTFTVAFTPQAAGLRSALIQVASNDANDSPFLIQLSGTGVLSNDARLQYLATDLGPTSPQFDPEITAYTTNVGLDTTSITLSAYRMHGYSTMTINGVTVDPLNPHLPFAVAVGSNIFSIVVTAQNGVTVQTYLLTVNAVLKDPAFDPLTPPRLSQLGEGYFGLGFEGLPGRTYGIQRCTDFTDWDQVSTITVYEDGAAEFIDYDAPQPRAFYRVVFPAKPEN